MKIYPLKKSISDPKINELFNNFFLKLIKDIINLILNSLFLYPNFSNIISKIIFIILKSKSLKRYLYYYLSKIFCIFNYR